MNKDTIKEILYIIVAVIMGVLIYRFIIWLFPVFIILIIACLIYSSLKKNSEMNNKKGKKIKVIHDDEIDNRKGND